MLNWSGVSIKNCNGLTTLHQVWPKQTSRCVKKNKKYFFTAKELATKAFHIKFLFHNVLQFINLAFAYFKTKPKTKPLVLIRKCYQMLFKVWFINDLVYAQVFYKVSGLNWLNSRSNFPFLYSGVYLILMIKVV